MQFLGLKVNEDGIVRILTMRVHEHDEVGMAYHQYRVSYDS